MRHPLTTKADLWVRVDEFLKEMEASRVAEPILVQLLLRPQQASSAAGVNPATRCDVCSSLSAGIEYDHAAGNPCQHFVFRSVNDQYPLLLL